MSRQMLCIETPCPEAGIPPQESPVKKGDIVTWLATTSCPCGCGAKAYAFMEHGPNYFFGVEYFVELPDMSEKALSKEKTEQHEAVTVY